MKLYITFGQNHVHRVSNRTFDCDSIASIECKDYADGRKKAYELFGNVFGTSYTEIQMPPDKIKMYFPRGVIDV